MPTKVEDSNSYGQVITKVKFGNTILTLHIQAPLNHSHLSEVVIGSMSQASKKAFLEYGILALSLGTLGQEISSVTSGRSLFSFGIDGEGLFTLLQQKTGTGNRKQNYAKPSKTGKSSKLLKDTSGEQMTMLDLSIGSETDTSKD